MDYANLKICYLVWDWSDTQLNSVDDCFDVCHKDTLAKLLHFTECSVHTLARHHDLVTTKDLVGELNLLKAKYDYVVVVGLGSLISPRYGYNCENITDFITKLRPAIAGHILDRSPRGRYYELHHQFFILRLDIVEEFTEDLFSYKEKEEKEWLMATRSPKNSHSNYTPFWLIRTKNPVYKSLQGRFGSGLIQEVLKKGMKIIRLSDIICQNKKFLYPKKENIEDIGKIVDDIYNNKEIVLNENLTEYQNTTLQGIQRMKNSAFNAFFFKNSEELENLNFNITRKNLGDGKFKFENVYVLTSGFKPLNLINMVDLDYCKNIVFYDVSERAIKYYKTFLTNYDSNNSTGSIQKALTEINEFSITKDDIDICWNFFINDFDYIIKKYKCHFESHNDLIRHVNNVATYKKIDLLEEYERIPANTLIWVSNIFHWTPRKLHMSSFKENNMLKEVVMNFFEKNNITII